MDKDLFIKWAETLEETPDFVPTPWVCRAFGIDIVEPSRTLFLMTSLGLLNEQLGIIRQEWGNLRDKVDNHISYKDAAKIIRSYVQS